MVCIPAFLLLTAYLASTAAVAVSSSDHTQGKRDFTRVKTVVETLRGKKFLRDVPVSKISNSELRALSDREIDRQFPGATLGYYEELLAWLDFVPPGTSLKNAEADFLVDQVAGLYDSVTKEMRIPTLSAGTTNAGRKAAQKLEEFSPAMDNIVVAHEFTHALEDQYWPMDDPRDEDRRTSTDRGTAHAFLSEGLATRAMIEAIPAEIETHLPGSYFPFWNLIHSRLGEFVLRYALRGVWKSDDALVNGVPDTLARSEAIPYSFGYSFCAEIMRNWGLDGLDYIYDHRPVSTEQVMHPKKAWEWRDFPVQITLPDTLAGNWEQVSLDCLGEAGIAIFFGCQFTNLNRGREIARGWDGDQAALFSGSAKQRLLLWASSWDSGSAAQRFASACVRERQLAHQAEVTLTNAHCVEWERPDGRIGFALRNGKRVILAETDDHEFQRTFSNLTGQVTFVEPPEDASRAAANRPLRRFNPVWSRQADGDYVVTRSLSGLLSRHDRNSVGAANRYLLELLAESRRTDSFKKWQIGGALLLKHESEARRGFTHTTVLPWGFLASRSSAWLPYSPDQKIARTTILWGIAGTVALDGAGVHSVRLLPFGFLFSRKIGPGQSSFHVLGTGFSRHEATDRSHSSSRCRILGIPLWTSREHPSPTH